MNTEEQKTPADQVVEEKEHAVELQTGDTQETGNGVNPRIAELEAQLADAIQRERDSLLRAKAEVENIRRRAEQDIEKAHKFALEKFSSELLPVIDNLERALELADKSNSELNSMIEGIELTLKSLLDVVKKFGINVVDETQVPFNPEIHQAITLVESEEHHPNQVVMMMQKGYLLNGRLLRPAMVTVAKAKA